MMVASKLDIGYSDYSKNRRDENGYIDLSGIEITEKESREKVGNINRDKNWVMFSDGRLMLLKEENILIEERNAGVYSELIIEELAKQAGFETAHYDLYKKDGKYGVLSEYCLNDNEEMFSFESLVGTGADSENSVENVDPIKLQKNMIEFLKNEGLSKPEIKRILVDFQKRMVFDIFTMNVDRHTENISFRVKNDNGNMTIDIAPMYDNENCLLLDMDYSTIDALLENRGAIRDSVDFIIPKIASIESEDESASEIWRNTLDEYCEVDEVYDYMMDLYEILDVEKAVQAVEQKIGARVPENVRKIAIQSFNFRKKEIDKVMCLQDYELT